jgi:choline dehydrogenase
MASTNGVNDGAAEYDFIIVGSGAGGGPLACNLARKRFRVLLIEAGGRRLPMSAEIPAFHALASEDREISWEYFVRHYAEEGRSRQDSKWCEERKGIFYPRASGLGGCTIHNAMITMSGPADDWNAIASLVDDQSWNSVRMRTYFERLENCHYIRPGYISPSVLGIVYDLLAKLRKNRGRHGFSGWLDTTWANPRLIRRDWQMVGNIVAALWAARKSQMTGMPRLLRGVLFGTLAAQLDPNHWERLQERPEGPALVPMAVQDGRRRSVRDYILETERAFPEYLTIWTDRLVTSVLFREGTTEACGVEYLHGANLYRAHAGVGNEESPEPRWVHARNEVILAAGAFNTPQLLMLSGIGPADELEHHRIKVRLKLPGVGTNLQDRYEVSVVWQMPDDFSVLKGLKFSPNEEDRELIRWHKDHDGLYASNGVLISILKKSRPDLLMPDLCIFALPGFFKGYYPGYSKAITADTKHLTWLILKAHTNNRQGTVRLKDADPRTPPDINFAYFSKDSGKDSDVEDDDLRALVEGIKFVRQFSCCKPAGASEVLPGGAYMTDEELRTFVAKEAWGHHASCSCPIGPAGDPTAVLDGNFRVRGTHRLRVVDASAFPQIPGLFIAANIYMLAERATDVICSEYDR